MRTEFHSPRRARPGHGPVAFLVALAAACVLLAVPGAGHAADARVICHVGFVPMGDSDALPAETTGYFARRHAFVASRSRSADENERLIVLRSLEVSPPTATVPTVRFDNRGFAIARSIVPVQEGQQVVFENVLDQRLSVRLLDAERGDALIQTFNVEPRGEAKFDWGRQSVVRFRVVEYPHMRASLVRVNTPYFALIPASGGDHQFTGVRPGRYQFVAWAGRWIPAGFRHDIASGTTYVIEADVTNVEFLNYSFSEAGEAAQRLIQRPPAPGMLPPPGSGLPGMAPPAPAPGRPPERDARPPAPGRVPPRDAPAPPPRVAPPTPPPGAATPPAAPGTAPRVIGGSLQITRPAAPQPDADELEGPPSP